MKIRKVTANNRKKAFEVRTYNNTYDFPYAKLDIRPSHDDGINNVFVDSELGNEAFTYTLESGREDSIHIDRVLEYNQDPSYMRDLMLYKLTVETKKLVESSALSKREMIRRLGTSPAQFYRILDEENYRKSIDQVFGLLAVLDCRLDFLIEKNTAREENARR
ncbi:MAG: hypothetical protein IH859_04370, partial [Chloroflexi bacterium]|nr:hypothetical protein [Chloroflexota bacterium]